MSRLAENIWDRNAFYDLYEKSSIGTKAAIRLDLNAVENVINILEKNQEILLTSFDFEEGGFITIPLDYNEN
jgi:hypothetical protein